MNADRFDDEIQAIEQELKARIAHYPRTAWGRKQGDEWDKATHFIYKTRTWAEMERILPTLSPDLAPYAVNRWFNFWSAVAIEKIFCSQPNVNPHRNQYHRLIDFSIQGISFDHKTTIFPKKYPHDLQHAWYNKESLIRWLYTNQSQEQRFHTANRLFIVLYDHNGEAWKLRAEIYQLARRIKRYISQFEPEKLVRFRLDAHSEEILSDLIWLIKKWQD